VSLSAVATDDDGAPTTSAAVGVTAVTGGPPPTSGSFLESGGQVAFEAESYAGRTARSSHDWTPATAPSGFSGTGAMAATPNSGLSITASIPATSPVLDYRVRFAQTGTYNIWVRGYGASGSDDSISVGADNAVIGSPSVPTGAFAWKKVGTLSVPAAGDRTLNIWMREDGAVVDKVLLSTAAATPTGTGPAESPRAGGGTPPPSNQPPTVALTAPASNAAFTLGAAVPLAADAADVDGSVASVVFRANGTPIPGCTDASVPYACSFTPASTGAYAITAVATDDDGAPTTSATRAISVTPVVTPPAGGTYVESGGTLTMEAERATITARGGKTWSTTTAPSGFAGPSALLSGPNTGLTVSASPATTSPSATLAMTITTPGSYSVWVRAYGPTGSDDSLYLGEDNAPGPSVAVSGTAWTWKKAGTVSLTAGAHTYSIWMREDGAAVDRLVLTTASTTPSGAGPAESQFVP
jgi:hypothetical protein